MTFEIGLMLAALAVAVVLFSLDWFTPDTVALGLLVTLVLTGLLPVERAFDGFGSDTVIVILALLILTAALTRTGVIDLVGRAILRRTDDNPERLLAVVMVSAAAIGAFMSNTAATAFFVPIVIGIAQRAGFSASRLLLPLAFAGILSSSVSLISTSSNLVISGLMTQKGLAPMGMFELAPVGIPITVAGLLYMYFIGRKFMPDRGGGEGLIEQFGVAPFLAEVLIPPDSPLVGKTLGETKFGSDLDLTVLEVIRDKDRHFAPRTTMKLAAGDVLLVEGRPDESRGEDLSLAATQAFTYIEDLTREDRWEEIPRYVLVSDFGRFALYDLEPEDQLDLPLFKGRQIEPHHFTLADFPRNVRHFAFMLGQTKVRYKPEDEANEKAYARMCELHDELREVA